MYETRSKIDAGQQVLRYSGNSLLISSLWSLPCFRSLSFPVTVVPVVTTKALVESCCSGRPRLQPKYCSHPYDGLQCAPMLGGAHLKPGRLVLYTVCASTPSYPEHCARGWEGERGALKPI